MAQNPTLNMSSSPDTAQIPPVFSGEFRPLLDAKKRLTIPARWRSDTLGNLFIIKSLTRGCLVAMPLAVLNAMGDNAGSQAASVEAHQAFKDHFFASAVDCPVDSQGRMVLSDDQCRFARIEKEKEVVLAGSGAKFDIWTPEAWQERKEAVTPTYTTILKSLGL
jgi:division/cell wall cluster transcriptional repressor MraZ